MTLIKKWAAHVPLIKKRTMKMSLIIHTASPAPYWQLLPKWGVLLLFAAPLWSQGDLLVFPKRIVFENRKKTETINLSNQGKDTATYHISFVQIRMTEYGKFETISHPDTGQMFADPFIRIYPRKVTLAPGESQIIKLQMTKTGILQPGEYRSHLYFRAEPSEGETDQEETVADANALSIRLKPVFGITIPVIIRMGDLTTRVHLENLAFERGNDSIPSLHFELFRTGNMSTYGTITAQYITPGGKTIKVGEMAGLAVYTPGNRRKCTLKLQAVAGVDYSKGKLILHYNTPPEAKSIEIATAELSLF